MSPSSKSRPWLALGVGALGVLLGYLMGGVRPRMELVEAEREIAELENELETGTGWRSPVPGLDRILQLPEADAPRDGSPQTAVGDTSAAVGDTSAADAGPPDDDAIDTQDAGSDAQNAPGWRARWRDRAQGDERFAGFERAASVQRVRRVQSRSALIEQAELSREETAELDAILSEFDTSFSSYGEEILMLAGQSEPPPPRYLLGVTRDVTGVLHDAQTRIDTLLGERAADIDPSAIEIWNHIDLDGLEPAARRALRRAR